MLLLTATFDVALVICVVFDVKDGTKALLVAKNVDRMMKMMETIGSILIAETLFGRERS